MKIQTPYFTLQHLLREFANGLGTKPLAAKEIDDACKDNEITPQQLTRLKSVLIHDPLTKHVNIYFADHVMEQIEKVFEQYIEVMTSVPLDGVSADKAQAVINKYFISFSVANICASCLDGMKITPQTMALSGRTMFDYTFENLRRSSEWCEFENKCTKEQKDRFRIWSLGEDNELPDIDSIVALGKQWERGNSWGTYKARLITARFWDYFFYRDRGHDLDLIRLLQQSSFDTHFKQQLIKLLHSDTVKYKNTSAMGLALWGLLRLRKPKTLQDKERCKNLLPILKVQLDKLDKKYEATYYYYWMQARFDLHQGNLSNALEGYKLAFEQVIYRQAANANFIIREALIVACRLSQPDKVFINRLRRMAVIFGIDATPSGSNKLENKKKCEDIESWEISAYAKDFNSFFTKDSFFPDAAYPPLVQPNYGLWMVDESAHKLDLRRPNKNFKVGMAGGLIKKMPQIVYFSMKDDIDAVKKLIEAGVDINKLSESKESALLMAVQDMQVNIDSLHSMRSTKFELIASLPDLEKSVNAVTLKKRLTPLGCAVQTGRLDIVKKVIELGAIVDLRHDVGDETPLFTCIGLIARHTRPAVSDQLAEMMKYSTKSLQSVRANAAGLFPHDLNHLKQVISKQERDPQFSSIMKMLKNRIQTNIEKYTTANDFREIALFLIEQGANPNARHDTAWHDFTPLMLAGELNEAKLFYLMAKAGGDINDSCLNPQNNQRKSCFEIAAHWRSQSVLELFKQS
jgi:ankyrin repeat protein